MSESSDTAGHLVVSKLKKHGSIPYRLGGRVRVAYTDGIPEAAVEKMQNMVKVMAHHIAEKLDEPDGEAKKKWQAAGLKQLDVCDEPCPEGILLTEVGVDWLVDRCARYHFRLELKPDGGLRYVPADGWQMRDWKNQSGQTISGVESVCPRWFLDACKRRKAEIIEFLKKRPVESTGGEVRS